MLFRSLRAHCPLGNGAELGGAGREAEQAGGEAAVAAPSAPRDAKAKGHGPPGLALSEAASAEELRSAAIGEEWAMLIY